MSKKRAVSAKHAELSVKLSSRGVTRLQGRHPWVYRSDVDLVGANVEANDVPPGSVVRVFDPRGKFLGTALYSSSSQIAIRMISHGSVADLPALVAERIRAAIAYRKELVSNTDAYRIGFSEAAFLDQRESDAAPAQYGHGEALDAFCSQGGFALHLAAKWSSVTGVDSSRPALEMAENNATLNARVIEWIEGNAFDLLREYAAANRRYDTIVLDPPAFAKTKRDLEKALGGYKELNLRAMKMLRPGGLLVTCSCSFHVSGADFLEVVADAARDAHKSLRFVEKLVAATDQPMP